MPEADLAILEIDSNLPFLELAPNHRFTRGEDVTVIGNPGLDNDVVLENAVSRSMWQARR